MLDLLSYSIVSEIVFSSGKGTNLYACRSRQVDFRVQLESLSLASLVARR